MVRFNFIYQMKEDEGRGAAWIIDGKKIIGMLSVVACEQMN